MVDRYEKKTRNFDITLAYNHYEDCTGGEEHIRQAKIQALKAYADAIDVSVNHLHIIQYDNRSIDENCKVL